MKRVVFGTHHYLAEWDFKFNTQKMNDGQRATLIAEGSKASGSRIGQLTGITNRDQFIKRSKAGRKRRGL